MELKPINIKKMLLIVFSAAAVGMIYNSISPDGIEFIRHKKNLKNASEPDLTEINSKTGIKRSDFSILKISLQQAYQIFRDSSSLFIDARDRWEFADGHIPNSINLAEYKFEPASPIVKSLDKNAGYVIYCGGDDCEVSLRLAEEMEKIGFNKLFVFEGGWKEWVNANYPVESDR